MEFSDRTDKILSATKDYLGTLDNETLLALTARSLAEAIAKDVDGDSITKEEYKIMKECMIGFILLNSKDTNDKNDNDDNDDNDDEDDDYYYDDDGDDDGDDDTMMIQ